MPQHLQKSRLPLSRLHTRMPLPKTQAIAAFFCCTGLALFGYLTVFPACFCNGVHFQKGAAKPGVFLFLVESAFLFYWIDFSLIRKLYLQGN